ncbi:hypothetical protein GCM10010431_32040 [Streptomyces kunmingensis]
MPRQKAALTARTSTRTDTLRTSDGCDTGRGVGDYLPTIAPRGSARPTSVRAERTDARPPHTRVTWTTFQLTALIAQGER